MPIGPGTRLGRYEVTALIGEGGMGQVYRATDTNLKRAVAIKVLPQTLANRRLQRNPRSCKRWSVFPYGLSTAHRTSRT